VVLHISKQHNHTGVRGNGFTALGYPRREEEWELRPEGCELEVTVA
jgi:hypothetical protein